VSRRTGFDSTFEELIDDLVGLVEAILATPERLMQLHTLLLLGNAPKESDWESLALFLVLCCCCVLETGSVRLRESAQSGAAASCLMNTVYRLVQRERGAWGLVCRNVRFAR
jgi:hypothetical protein